MASHHPGIQLIAILLLLSTLLTLFDGVLHPPQAQAQGVIVSFTTCVASQFIANLLLEQIQRWIGSALNAIFGRVPVYDSSTNAVRWKEYVIDVVVRCTAREILRAMNNNILTTVRTSGRVGGPAWVRNWRNFLTTGQYRGEDVFRAMLSTTNLCPHLAQDLRTIFNATQTTALPGQNTRVGDLDPYQLRANCTLPPGFTMANFVQNVGTNGGWEAFLRLHQPQNNIYGQILASMDEVARQRNVEESGDIYETLGHGFTGRRGSDATVSCLVRGLNGQCIVHRDILTPGVTLEGSIMNTIEKELEWVANSDELSELVATGIQLLINRLNNLGDPNEGNLIVPNTLANQPVGTFPPDPNIPGGPGGTGGTGACAVYLTPGAPTLQGDVESARDSALDTARASGLADQPADAGNVQAFRDLVIAAMPGGVEASTAYNANCNVSPNQVAVRASGAATGQAYDVIREDPFCTVEEATLGTGACAGFGRPNYVADGSWSFLTTGAPPAGGPPAGPPLP